MCDIDGNIPRDTIEVLNLNFQLPELVVDIHPPNAPSPMLMIYNPEIFNPSQYIFVNISTTNNNNYSM